MPQRRRSQTSTPQTPKRECKTIDTPTSHDTKSLEIEATRIYETPRRSPRRQHADSGTKRGHVSDSEDEPDDDVEDLLVARSRNLKLESRSPSKSPLKRSRTETASSQTPKVYVDELPKGLPDRLLEGLDIVFCGINPGLTSNSNGFHYSGRGNQFWECLLQANFITPDITYRNAPELPSRFSIGMTDLVTRATAKASELSQAEMRESLPLLLKKISEHRPRVVSFLSIGLCELITTSISCPWKAPKAPRETKRMKPRSLSPQKKSPKKASTQVPPGNVANFREYLLPFKLKYPNANAEGISETLFFAMPSTSAANGYSYRLEDKIVLFRELHSQLQLIKEQSPDALDISSLTVIDPLGF
ncbi:uracil-DNA glycosylase-like protein [Rhodocollybia butyracea]|uniref:Uracil-DNA glycosylase-like protein n=1 Tax=Rhodocollybia butyracea TaxID=206335 RepID=A0A9P5PUC1_9AGAR|nr:uracil-DNA glycosylase-like protein [Rhodocollybia butyracea]